MMSPGRIPAILSITFWFLALGCADGPLPTQGDPDSAGDDAAISWDLPDPTDVAPDSPQDPGVSELPFDLADGEIQTDQPSSDQADQAQEPDLDDPDEADPDPDDDIPADVETEPADRDGDGIPDEWDAFPDDRNEWNDNDDDGIGDNADPDDDDDGLADEEELSYGVDCMMSDPYHADGDGDGIADDEDPYPLDPFPEFVINANNEGSVYFFLSNRDGTFRERMEWGNDIGGNYRIFAIADFDDNGRMDFIAHSATADENQLYDMYFFYRTEKEDEFQQIHVGTTTLRAGDGVVADVNGDRLFDVVVSVLYRPEYIGSITGWVFLNNGNIRSATCAVAAYPDTSCAFTLRQAFYLGAGSVVENQWSYALGRQAVDITDDGHKDLVLSVYPNGGVCNSSIYLLEGQGDGTFSSSPTLVLTHSLAAVNSLVFADFTSDEVGDVIMGLDDDGDAGQAWLYLGNGTGGFESTPQPAFDIEPTIESGADHIGVTSTARTFDFDFDGRMDVMVSHVNGSSPYLDGPSIIQLFRGNGDGSFGEPTQVGPTITTALGNTFEIPQRLCPWFE